MLKRRYGKAKDADVGDSVSALLKAYQDSNVGESADNKQEFTAGEIDRVIKSLQDYFAFQEGYAKPVIQMLEYLERFFDPGRPRSEEFDLSIRSGQRGSCLSHDHATHYTFVSQSLTLWKNIMEQMYELWSLAEQDMLLQGYSLQDTGQGLNRMQRAPSVGRKMSEILHHVQRECVQMKRQSWVGLSVVHLGDRDVPNALVFIDKYTQVPRILAPLVHIIEQLPELYAKDDAITRYIDEYGGCEAAQRKILRDFFMHGFDGSGDDGGSCIDGRLTSCWNWCGKVEKKSYFPLFLLCGFSGFDG